MMPPIAQCGSPTALLPHFRYRTSRRGAVAPYKHGALPHSHHHTVTGSHRTHHRSGDPGINPLRGGRHD